MRSAEREHLLPLWEPAAATSAVTTPEESTPSMILISVPYALQSGLRAVARDVDGVDSELRRKIRDRLPSSENQEHAAAAGSGDGALALPPSTLAQALPHLRRLMPRGEGGAGESALGLLRGGRLVFEDSRRAGAALKEGTEKREFDERRSRLILLREHREYARMTSNIQRAPRETVRDIQVSFKFQAGMGANMVLAVATTFIISYWASKYVVGDNKSHRMVIGLVGAVFIMLVELLVFVTRSLKADEVLEAARRDAEESHTDVGVHRLAPRVEPRGGRGVLEENDANGRQYELVATGLDEKRNGVSDAGIVRISKE